MGYRIHHYERVSSTNEVASKLAGRGAPEGTVVVAKAQSKGRGRLGRKWFSPPGGLWMSVVLRPRGKPFEALNITLMAGLCVAETLERLYGLEAVIKWPNDVRVRDKKICGVLSEMRTRGREIDYVVLGVGVNANIGFFPEDLCEVATCIRRELGREVSIKDLMMGLLESLEERYGVLLREGFEPILRDWMRYSDTIGRRVRFRDRGGFVEGEAVGVDLDGSLLVKMDGETRRVFTSDYVYVI